MSKNKSSTFISESVSTVNDKRLTRSTCYSNVNEYGRVASQVRSKYISKKIFSSLLLVLVFLSNIQCICGLRTAWVRQSHSPFDIEDKFRQFVESSGGNGDKFKFYGNLFSSEDKPLKWESPTPTKSSLKSPELTNVQSSEIAEALEKAANDAPQRVPRSFYSDIFDSSLPKNSPYHIKDFHKIQSTKLPPVEVPEQFQNIDQFNHKLPAPYSYSHSSNHLQAPLPLPFPSYANEFISTSVPQKIRQLRNFAFQNIGYKKFSSNDDQQNGFSSFSHRNLSPIDFKNGSEIFSNKLEGTGYNLFPSSLGSRRVKNSYLNSPFKAKDILEDISSIHTKHMDNFEQVNKPLKDSLKPKYSVFSSSLYQSADASHPARGSVSLGFGAKLSSLPRPQKNKPTTYSFEDAKFAEPGKL